MKNKDENIDKFFDKSGFYVTLSQIVFFFNDAGSEKVLGAGPEFHKFVNTCKINNYVSDAIDANLDPEAYMFWSEKLGHWDYKYPQGGVIDKKITPLVTTM